MTIEYLAEKAFFKEVETSGQIWVARSVHKNIYALSIDRTGFSLPVWSNQERVVDFLDNARLVGPKYEPDAVPLDVFAAAWLSDRMMAIVELQLNPDGKSARVLVMTPDEFHISHAQK